MTANEHPGLLRMLTDEPALVARWRVGGICALLYLYVDEGMLTQEIDIIEMGTARSLHSGTSDWSLGTEYLPSPRAVRMSGFSSSLAYGGRDLTFASGIRSSDVAALELGPGVEQFDLSGGDAPGPPFILLVPEGRDADCLRAGRARS